MKKLILIQICILIFSGIALSQKVNFSVGNQTYNSGILSWDVIATIPSGQTWNVGPTCIRIQFGSNPPGALSVIEDNPAYNSNVNISNNANYQNMSTNIIMNNSAISLNIFLYYNHAAYQFTSGTYTLGSIRFNVLDSTACDSVGFLPISAIFDNLSALTYSSGWTGTNTGCNPIGINTRQINKVPMQFQLYQNYPNPFNPTTTIKYSIPKSSNVKIEIFDLLGRNVESLVNSKVMPGTYEVTWNAENYASGLYFYRITAGDFVMTKKMLLIK